MRLALATLDERIVGSDPGFRAALVRHGASLDDSASLVLHACTPQEFQPRRGRINVLWFSCTEAPMSEASLKKVRRADGLLVTSRYGTELANPELFRSRVPYAIARPAFDPSIFHRDAGRKSVELIEGLPFVVLVDGTQGELSEEGIAALAEAWRDSLGDDQTVKLVVLLHPDAASLAGEQGNVTISAISASPGYRASCYRGSNLLVIPSTTMSPGRVRVEAAACGLPIVAPFWGADLSFTCEKTAFHVNHRMLRATAETEAICDPADLARILGRARRRYGEHQKRARRAAVRAGNSWTIDEVARDVRETLRRIRNSARSLKLAA